MTRLFHFPRRFNGLVMGLPYRDKRREEEYVREDWEETKEEGDHTGYDTGRYNETMLYRHISYIALNR